VEGEYSQPVSPKPVEHKITAPAPVKTQPKSFSIKNAISGKGENLVPAEVSNIEVSENADNEDILDEEDASEETSVFTQQELEIHWQAFIDTNLTQKPGYSSLLKNYLPDIGGDFVLNIFFETQLQLDMFRELKNEIVIYLRKKLENKYITISETLLGQENTSAKLYTIEDKFKYLSQKQPNIIKLKQQLNLDFE
jgi:hypothetical protein